MKRAIVLVLVIGLVTLWPTSAHADQVFHGLSITPAIQQIDLADGQPSTSYQVRLDNNESSPITLQASSLDFKSLNDTGGLAFIANNASQLEHRYGLASYISLPSDPIVLPPNGGQFINVTVNNLTNLSPGGHYAAVLFRVVLPSNQTGANTVQTDQIISSLVFVRKNGGAIYKLSLNNLTIRRGFSELSWPNRLDALFYNGGNVQTAPVGLANLAGQHIQLNTNSSLVLPGSSRLISADLTGVKKPFWPGRYMVNVNYHPDQGGGPGGEAVTFMYIGWPFLAVLGLVIATIINLLPKRHRQAVVKRLIKSFNKLKYLPIWAYKLLRWLLKVALKFFAYLDYLAGVALLAWDKKRNKKSREK